MCYITNNQSDDQNQQRNFAKFFAPNQNYYNQFAIPLNEKQQHISEYQDESNNLQEGQEQYQYGYVHPFQQQQQHVVYLDSKPYNQYGFSTSNNVNENEIFNIMGPINENEEQQQQQQGSENEEFNGVFNQFNDIFDNENDAPFFFGKNEEENNFQPTFQDNNIFNYENIIYNNNSIPQTEELRNNFIVSAEQNQEMQYYPQQFMSNNQYAEQNYDIINEYPSQIQIQQSYQPQIKCAEQQQQQQQQLPQMIENLSQVPFNQMQGNFQYLEGMSLKQECKNDVQSSSEICDEDENNLKYEDTNDDEFTDDGHEKQNKIIDKIRKSNKKNVVKNIMSAFKRFIQDIQSESSQSPSPANLDSTSSSSSTSLNSSQNSFCSSATTVKASKISNLKQNTISTSETYHIDVAVERENVLSIYNGSKAKPDSIEEMGKKFKRYISSKQFNHYTIRLLVQHSNYGGIFKYFLESHAQSWLNNSKVDDPYGHKIMIEFLCSAYEDINIIEKLKKHEKRKAIYQ